MKLHWNFILKTCHPLELILQVKNFMYIFCRCTHKNECCQIFCLSTRILRQWPLHLFFWVFSLSSLNFPTKFALKRSSKFRVYVAKNLFLIYNVNDQLLGLIFIAAILRQISHRVLLVITFCTIISFVIAMIFMTMDLFALIAAVFLMTFVFHHELFLSFKFSLIACSLTDVCDSFALH